MMEAMSGSLGTPLRQSSVPYADLGAGAPLVFLGGFARTPAVYADALERLSTRVRIVAPSVFEREGRWDYPAVLDEIVDLLHDRGIERATVLGHSFGGSIAVGLAARHPEFVSQVVFANSDGLSPSWQMAADAFSPRRLWQMFRSDRPLVAVETHGQHPLQLLRIGWWAFRADKIGEARTVRRTGIPASVVFGPDDILIPPARGTAWAAELGARYETVDPTAGHDWPITHAALFADVVAALVEDAPSGWPGPTA